MSLAHPAASRTSSTTPNASPPASSIAAAASGAPFTSTQNTLAPPAANPSAVDWPIPLPAPVTIATLLANCFGIIHLPILLSSLRFHALIVMPNRWLFAVFSIQYTLTCQHRYQNNQEDGNAGDRKSVV